LATVELPRGHIFQSRLMLSLSAITRIHRRQQNQELHVHRKDTMKTASQILAAIVFVGFMWMMSTKWPIESSNIPNTPTINVEKWEYGELAETYTRGLPYNYYWETRDGTIEGKDYKSLLSKINGTNGSNSTDVLNALGQNGWELVNFDRSVDSHYGAQRIWTLKRLFK